MQGYDTYVFVLCFIVLALLTLIFSSMLLTITRLSVKLIHAGVDDKPIYRRYLRTLKRGKNGAGWSGKAITAIFACLVFAVFGFTVYMQTMADKTTLDMPTLRVVYSDSMSDKYEGNKYLFENELDDQFDRFDVLVTYQLPKEEDLQLYDIVVYEVDGVLLVHRIIEIEEPNEKHPDGRYFRLQGDLVESPDKFPVRYEQMKAIYRGEHIHYVGSFILFLQSPAGYMCFIFLVIEMFTSPLITKKIAKEERRRVRDIEWERKYFGDDNCCFKK